MTKRIRKTGFAEKRKSGRKDNVYGVLFSLSPVLGFALFGLIPMLLSVYMSFGRMTTFDIFDIKMVGLDNYVRIFTEDTLFFKSILNSIVYAACSVFLQTVLALFAAVLLNTGVRGKKVFRLLLFIPYVCSVVATSTMWKWMFDYNFGVLNDIASALGLGRVDWLKNSRTAMPVMILQTVWSGTGFGIILYTAALNAVSASYTEAARIDGAGAGTTFFRVTLPLISPTTFYLLVMGLIGAMQAFANFQIMTPTGGPDDTTLTMVFRVYNAAFVDDSRMYGMGYASALAWLVGLIVIALTALNFRLSKRWVYYE